MAMRVSPYIVTDGNGKEAVAFYEKALGAKVAGVMTYGEAPADPNYPPPPVEVKDLVLHAMLTVGDTAIMISDNYPGGPYQIGNNVTVAFITDDVAAAKRAFDALAEGGKVELEFQETFWSPGYGQVIDTFGISWQISTEAKE